MKARFAMGWRLLLVLLVEVAMLGLAGCGGGGGGDGDNGGGGSGGGTFQGSYSGTFNGTDIGTWRITVNSVGDLVGTAHSNLENLDYTIDGSVNGAGVLTAGLYDGSLYKGTYNGAISAAGAVSGTWHSTDSENSGAFTGQRS